ncbi:hypothetical protein QJS10_CPA16g00029 [Acorus calamus]|uniref:ARGOS-like protein n=1 Tax=Acorus calamus TaxID=4465 RepID=A0AAV9D0S9_ACOCL|nr:hypothetical protein QJS10_CPA16g00029 [Acorus calamus]
MSFESPDVIFHRGLMSASMERGSRFTVSSNRGGFTTPRNQKRRPQRQQQQQHHQSPLMRGDGKASYFGVESFLVLLCLTASLLLLPLVLPPLPPPPFLLLLLPIGILGLLLVMAFMPSDIRGIASSYL